MPYLQPGHSNQSKSRPMPHLPPPPAGLTLIGLLCSSRKYPCPPQGRLTEIPRGRGVSKAQIYEGKYGTKMEFSEGWEGSILKTFRGRGMDIFWNNTFKINEFDHIKLKIKNCDPIPQFMYIHLWLGICIFNEAWNAYFHNFPCVQRLQNVLLKDPSTYCF